jgi:ABC-type phosphate transport system substrate-binding protein
MKSVFKSVVLVGFLLSVSINNSVFGGDHQTITINTNGSKFVLSILEKWTTEYQKENPEINFTIEEQAGNSSLSVIVSHEASDQKVAFTGRYALLPISHPDNPSFRKAKGLNKKEVKEILFERNILDEEDDYGKKEKYKVNVYSRVSKAGGTSTVLANYFESTPKKIKGKKLYGDEIYILNAIKKDSIGFAYTNLNYIFNLQTRALKPELSLVPLNIKSKQKEQLYSANIDHVISLLETEEIDLIPVETFGFAIQEGSNSDVTDFVKWILTKGQQYNHALGFLELSDQALAQQINQLKNEYFSSIQ